MGPQRARSCQNDRVVIARLTLLLVIGTALRLLPALNKNLLGRVPALLVGLLTLVAVAALRWPLVWVISGLGTLSVALAWLRLRLEIDRRDAKNAKDAKKD